MGVVIVLAVLIGIVAVTTNIKRSGSGPKPEAARLNAHRTPGSIDSRPPGETGARGCPRGVLPAGGRTTKRRVATAIATVATIVAFFMFPLVLGLLAHAPATAAPDRPRVILQQSQGVVTPTPPAPVKVAVNEAKPRAVQPAVRKTSEADDILDSPLWYQEILIWKDGATGKYRTMFTADSYETLAEAKARAGEIHAEQEAYMAKLMAEVEEDRKELEKYLDSDDYKQRIAKLQEEADRILREAGYRPSAGAERTTLAAHPSEDYFREADLDGSGKLDWGEIRAFQAAVYKKFSYQANARVLSPDEFMRAGGGDCDDFAAFSASFLRSYGYQSYVLTLAKGEDTADHAVAGLFIGDEGYKDGCLKVNHAGLYNPRVGSLTGVQAPSGNYVILDYWKVGAPVESFDSLEHVADVEDVINSSW